ncbi:apoptotic protease-activating factor 1-like [Xenia sp. Carnegie-2017]|uniref:apoptotic protease-activating factor 1-like n=1 Tax=Xenia sp. Carnegie-2017 TaxID=2897299 RepID=UPI001F047F78|nr:apoptotic protease-activating factor 1-like [Xenia sp. Carnegie-2017]
MLEEHKHLLNASRISIVQDLIVDDVLTELKAKFIVDISDCEEIKAEVTTRKRAEKLLDLLPKKGYDAFSAFHESLTEKYPHLAQLLSGGVNGVSYNEEDVHGVYNYSNSEVTMTNDHRDILNKNREAIVEDLLVDDISSPLVSNLVFNDDDLEMIRSEKTSRLQADKLLDLLVTRGDKAFDYFLSALESHYPHLVEILQENEGLERSRFPSVSADAEKIVAEKLLKGGVPKLPQVFISRPREIKRVRTALRSLKDRDAWVVIHGMAGSGKTILAADALRSASLLDEIFPGGVVWAHIGLVNKQKLLMKMQNLCTRLDENKYRPQNLEEAREHLKSVFADQYPQTLLVLDDVWTAHDARFFDIRARVLLTTRNVSVADNIEVKRCPVKVSEKLSNEQCMEIFRKWTNKKSIIELPLTANKIIEECNGNPLVVSIIGALLRDNPTRWDYYYSQLHEHKFSKLKPNKFAYDYPNLNKTLAMSMEDLQEDLREKIYDFVIFDSSIKASTSLFCRLWEMEVEEVEDIMQELINKSLVYAEQSCDHDTTVYYVHNLQLNYMVENCDNVLERHKKLVECYKKACEGLYWTLEDDGYVYSNLVHHMLLAKQEGDAIQLLTNREWITNKLKICGPADVINDFLELFTFVKEDEKNELKRVNEFYHFVRTHAHMFTVCPFPDVVQIALSEPSDSDAYKQAKKEALRRSKDEGKLYLDWCNKQNAQTLEMTVKPHNGPVHCCVFSSHGQYILSSSSDGTAKVWEAVSGKIIHTLDGRDDIITCCAFNKDDTEVLTTSYDKCVKIWQLGVNSFVKVEYKEHKQDVHCAAFSPTSNEVVSCSADSTLRVWDSGRGFTKAVCKGHDDVVNWCSFSFNGLIVVSGSNDETVKVWKSDTGECLATTKKLGSFVSYCCFHIDGCRVFASSGRHIWIINSSSGELVSDIDIGEQVLAFSLSSVENKIAVALCNNVQLWDFELKNHLNTYFGHKNWVHSVNFSPNGKQLVSGSSDETVKVWPAEAVTSKVIRLRKVFDVFFEEELLSSIAVADSENRVKVFEGIEGKYLCQSDAHTERITCVLFSGDGHAIAVGLNSGLIEILCRKTCRLLHNLVSHDKCVNLLAYSINGSVLLSCSEDKTFMTWDGKTGQNLLMKEKKHDGGITEALFFQNDKRILTASRDGFAKVWDSKNGNIIFSCEHSKIIGFQNVSYHTITKQF